MVVEDLGKKVKIVVLIPNLVMTEVSCDSELPKRPGCLWTSHDGVLVILTCGGGQMNG